MVPSRLLQLCCTSTFVFYCVTTANASPALDNLLAFGRLDLRPASTKHVSLSRGSCQPVSFINKSSRNCRFDTATKSTSDRTAESFIEEQTRVSLIEAVLGIGRTKKDFASKGSLLSLDVVGQTKLPPASSSSSSPPSSLLPCIVLCPPGSEQKNGSDTEPPTAVEATASDSTPLSKSGLILPLTSRGELKLLAFAKANKRLSKSVMLGLNSLLVNRDDSLFDNLPWSTWSVDPQKRNRDPAGNPIDSKFHLGKRDAYNRFMGKDWQGKSASVGNLSLRLKYLLEQEKKNIGSDEINRKGGIDDDYDVNMKESTVSLAQRILELQIREKEMDLAEYDYQLAIQQQRASSIKSSNGDSNNDSKLSSLQKTRTDCENQIKESKISLEKLILENKSTSNENPPTPFLFELLDKIADWSTDEGKNAAPYRGAIGYSPMLDTKEEIEESKLLQYSSPFDLLREVINDQLNAEVIGCVLENSSILSGYIALGGAVILRRKTATKDVVIAGEKLTINDEDEEFGNLGIKGGEIILVECDADEALGLSMACNIPVRIEREIWERTNSLLYPPNTTPARVSSSPPSVWESLPMWKAQDKDMSLLVEGDPDNDESENLSDDRKTAPLQIPRTTTSLFDSLFESTSSSPSGMFPTDNPIQSLDEYDAQKNEDKARILLSLSNFDGKLPRPRVLRQYEELLPSQKSTELRTTPTPAPDTNSGTIDTATILKNYDCNPLDKLLLPLIDESVRSEYLIREAERKEDYFLLEQLKSARSKRQIAREKAQQARDEGNGLDDNREVIEYWENEANIYESLRADITQDVGSYNRFLDRDEWYERDRQKQIKKLDKKKFGTLLDGIE